MNNKYSVATTKKVVRIAEAPSKLSTVSSDRYLRNAIREGSSLLEKLSSIPRINAERKL